MQIVVADSNVFVYLYRAGLLAAIFGRADLEICIPEKIFEELTSGNRIPREEPNLPEVMWKIKNDPQNEWSIRLRVISINDFGLEATEVYVALQDSGIDDGELEAIPLAIDLGGLFISADGPAIKEMRKLNASATKFFPDYCTELRADNVITAEDLENLNNIIFDRNQGQK